MSADTLGLTYSDMSNIQRQISLHSFLYGQENLSKYRNFAVAEPYLGKIENDLTDYPEINKKDTVKSLTYFVHYHHCYFCLD